MISVGLAAAAADPQVKALWPLVLVLAYMLGSIPFPLLISRSVKGIDLREHGSGNMGAANAKAVLGLWPAIAIGALDAAKGLAAVYLGWLALGQTPQAAVLSGVAAVAGHVFPVFAGFRGGKGIATSGGALLAFMLTSPPVSLTLLLKVALGWFLYWVFLRRRPGNAISKANVTASYTIPAFLLTEGHGTFGILSGLLWAIIITIPHWNDLVPPNPKAKQPVHAGPQPSRRERREAARSKEKKS